MLSARTSLVFSKEQYAGFLNFIPYAIDAFLNERTLEYASERGSLCLLNQLHGREWAGMSHEFRIERMEHAILEAAKHGKIEIMNWWVTTYDPEECNIQALDKRITGSSRAMDQIKEAVKKTWTLSEWTYSSFACARCTSVSAT